MYPGRKPYLCWNYLFLFIHIQFPNLRKFRLIVTRLATPIIRSRRFFGSSVGNDRFGSIWNIFIHNSSRWLPPAAADTFPAYRTYVPPRTFNGLHRYTPYQSTHFAFFFLHSRTSSLPKNAPCLKDRIKPISIFFILFSLHSYKLRLNLQLHPFFQPFCLKYNWAIWFCWINFTGKSLAGVPVCLGQHSPWDSHFLQLGLPHVWFWKFSHFCFSSPPFSTISSQFIQLGVLLLFYPSHILPFFSYHPSLFVL